MDAVWTESDRATKLGIDHRDLIARSDYFWPYLRPLWQPKSYATWVLHLKIIEKYLTIAPDRELIPFEIIITAAECGRGYLDHDANYQRHALKHFLCPWRITNCSCSSCKAHHKTTTCCDAESYCPPRHSQPRLSSPSVDFNLPELMQEPTHLLRDLIAELRVRWGKNRETADSRLEVAVASAMHHVELSESEQTCTLCREDFDDDKLLHMPIAAYKYTFAYEGQQNLTDLAKYNTVLDVEYIKDSLSDYHYYDAIANIPEELRPKGSSTFMNDWHALQSGLEFAFRLGIASASLNIQKSNRDDGCCGRPVITSCCKQVLGLDCLRKALDPEYLVDKKAGTRRASTCPLCRHAHPEPHPLHEDCSMLRKLDGSWLHHRYPSQVSFLPPGTPPPSKYTQPLGDPANAKSWPTLPPANNGFGNFWSMRTALAAVARKSGNVDRK